MHDVSFPRSGNEELRQKKFHHRIGDHKSFYSLFRQFSKCHIFVQHPLLILRRDGVVHSPRDEVARHDVTPSQPQSARRIHEGDTHPLTPSPHRTAANSPLPPSNPDGR
jgi:hypothetical protein